MFDLYEHPTQSQSGRTFRLHRPGQAQSEISCRHSSSVELRKTNLSRYPELFGLRDALTPYVPELQ